MEQQQLLAVVSGFEARSVMRVLSLGKGEHHEGRPEQNFRQEIYVGQIPLPLLRVLNLYRMEQQQLLAVVSGFEKQSG